VKREQPYRSMFNVEYSIEHRKLNIEHFPETRDTLHVLLRFTQLLPRSTHDILPTPAIFS
jgi:hypothetical protein